VFAYNLGIFALYLAVLVGPTYYFRRKIGPVRWRFLHRLALIVYVLSVWHTLLLGLDFSYYPWVRPLTWLAQIPLLVLFVRRLMRPARSGKTLSTACGDWLTATRYALVALSVAAIVGIALLVVTGHSDLPARVGYHTPMARVVGNPWLPLWLRIVATAAFGAVLVVHLWHIARCAGRERAWHSGHVLMALGMIVMFLPTSGMIVSARGGQVVFAVAALGVGGSLLADAMRYRRVGALWVVGCVDLAAMAYMFVMPSAPAEWLTGLAVAWFALQAFGWATGRLGTMADLGGPRSAEVVGAAGTEVSVCSAHRQVSDRSVRATLTVMSLGMGYMFLAMQFGMHQMSIMPGMPGM
ncbi:MAG: DUF5134 domain-containing protein, partial [Sciscionella sp.]